MYTAQIKLGNVPWNDDYKAVVDFASTQQQFNEISKLCPFEKEYLSPIMRDNFIEFSEISSDFYNFNYLMYKNDIAYDNTTRWWYAFITRVEIVAEKTTRIYYTTDIWQQYHIRDMKLLKSFVLREHIPASEDNIKRWVAPEPFSLSPSFSKQIDEFTTNWNVNWLINSVSYPVGDSFVYGGLGQNANITGVYASRLQTSQEIQTYINQFLSGLDDHRPDVNNITAVPEWCFTNSEKRGTLLEANNLVSVNTENVTLNNNTLANGYTPINKKLLSSLGRCYAVYNKNGFTRVLKPELFKQNSTHIKLSCRPIGLNQIKCELTNYENINDSVFNFPYSASLTVAYNENTGLISTLNKTTAILGAVQTGASVIGEIAPMVASGGVGVLAGVGTLAGTTNQIINAGVSVYQAFQEKTAGGGSSPDTTGISEEYIKLRFLEINPLVYECQLADEYLSMYGYAINEVKTPNYKTRPHFNYIQTANVNLTVNANSNDENALKSMFNAGMTIFHSVNDFGKFDFADNNR